MTTVFLSGSRKINLLDDEVRGWLHHLVDQNIEIIVGDADGADKAFQKYFSELHYRQVTVFCSGSSCRNNLGNWNVDHVSVDTKTKDRAFYIQKDKAMATRADSGFVLWDGKSPGSLNNIMQLLKMNKDALVYFFPDKKFYSMSSSEDARQLLKKGEQFKVSVIGDKTSPGASTTKIADMAQGRLNL